MKNFPALLLACLAGTSLLAACGSSTLTPAGRTTITSLSRTIVPTTSSDAPAIVPLASGGFIACTLDDDAQLSVQRYDDDLSVRWSTPVRGTTVGVTEELHGTNRFRLPDPQERILSLLGVGSEVLLLTYRSGEEDRNAAIGRRFDASTGRVIDTAVLFTSRHEYADDVDPELTYREVDALRRCHVAISPDSARIVVYAFSPDRTAPDISFAVVDRSLTVFRTGETPAARAAKPSLTTVQVDDAGTVYVVRVDNGELGAGFRVDAIRADGSVRDFQTPILQEKTLGSPRLVFEPAGPVLFAPIHDNGDLTGIAVGSIDVATEDTRMRRIDIGSEVIETATGSPDLSNAWLHPIVVSSGPTRYTLVLERRAIGSTRVTREGTMHDAGYATVGSALLLGLGADGTLGWTNGIDKRITFDNYTHGFHEHFGGLRSHVAADGTLHLIYRNWFDIGVRRIRLADGATITPESDLVFEASARAIPLTTTATWLRDDRFVMLSKHGMMATEVMLNRVDY